MEYSLAMGVSNGAGSLRHHPDTLARTLAELGCRHTKAAARCKFHAEKRQTLLTFAHFVDRKDAWMIQTGDRFGFAPKTHQRLMRIHLMSKDAFDRDNATGVLLSGAMNPP